MAKREADRTKALELFEKAVARDKGKFDQEALDCLREAAALAPDNKEIASRLEKMASYTRTLRVPGDYATPAEALAVAHDRDRIVLAEQTWKGPLFITAAVELQGTGSGKTIIECPAADGSALTLGPKAKGARVTGITFRHESFDAAGAERYAAVVVRGAEATFDDCVFRDASGHGLAAIENAVVSANRCKFTENGWNGASVSGKGSRLEARDCEAIENYEHGIEAWQGASLVLSNSRCEGNSRNGVHVDSGNATTAIEGCQLVANREFGLVLDSAGSGKVAGNTARGNLLGGLVIRKSATAASVTGNTATLNQGPGIVLEKSLSQASYANNSASKNTPRDILAGAELDGQETQPDAVRTPQ
jgi:parallel beta-helix repeat protein